MRATGPLALCSAIVLAYACSDTPPDDSPRWLRVARDANYTIYLDTGRMGTVTGPGYGGEVYDVWYRTDHAVTRVHEKDNALFNREVVHSIVQCDNLRFRVASVDMSMGNKRPVVRQRLTEEEVDHQDWRRIELGTSEEMAGRAACDVARRIAAHIARTPPR